MVDKSTVQGDYVMVAQLFFFSFDALDLESRKLDLNLMNCKCLSVMSSNLGDDLNFGKDLTFQFFLLSSTKHACPNKK